MNLQIAVESFARAAFSLTDTDLERPWVWGEYDEGLRFAFFRTYEELRTLAVNLLSAREQLGRPRSMAQVCLGQYHQAYQDLQAALIGITDMEAERPPQKDAWPVRTVLVHIIEVERSFFAVTHYAVERFRSQSGGLTERPLAMPDEEWDAFWAASDDAFDRLKESAPFSELKEYYTGLHNRVMNYFSDASDAELQAPSVYWESTPMPVVFRLHRFDSHLRQHTVQVDKTLLALQGPPSEARRLLRLIYAALAETQAYRIIKLSSAAGFGVTESDQLANEIMRRTDEIIALTR